ncbi:hypothetical protein V1264_017180 [Littorina saxatilis]|uniref:Uncharacterized protein n=2 Tax=Littorina saxatilis TaxID=31220 RepID=A0AAN9BIQ4_9CAEN
MPKWIPILAILLVAVLATALLGVLVLALWVCRANYFRTSIIVNQSPPPPPPQAEVQASKPSAPKKASRRWPWQRPSKPPCGHFGLDGVAWTVSPDDSILPVKRRF